MDEKSFEINFMYIRDHLENISTKIEKLNDKQEAMNVVLTENTVIVKEHERRSTTHEKWAEKTEERFNTALNNITVIDSNVRRIDDDLVPIKKHVKKVAKVFNFLTGIPVVLKIAIMIITIASSVYGICVLIFQLMSKG